MSKKKKDKKPNIPMQTMARPRLEQLFVRYQHEELDEDEFVASIEQLMVEMGREPVLNALLGLLDHSTNEQKDGLMVAISRLGDKDTIDYLWRLVRRSQASMGTKMTALVILKQLGETVNLEDPGEYLSWRDVKQADQAEVADIARFSLRAVIKELQRAKTTDDVEGMMLRYAEIAAKTGGEEMILATIGSLIEMADTGAADMLLAIAFTTSSAAVRQAARKGLLKLSGQKIFPQSQTVKSLNDERFYAAYSTNPAHPWQQGVSVVFERNNQVQALVFLLDYGSPWQGAIKDVFPTYWMTPQQFQKEFLNRIPDPDAQYHRTTYARARQFILDALEANQKNRIKLPSEFNDFRYLLDRRVVDPSAETLAHAAEVDARTHDEWPLLKGAPIRGMEVFGPDGKPIPMTFDGVHEGLFENLFDDDEEYTLEDLIDEVTEYYFEDETDDDEDDEADETAETIIIQPDESTEFIPYEWTVEYLSTRFDEGIDLEELQERWMDLQDLIYYADASDEVPPDMVDLQGYHLSQLVTDFWDEEFDEDSPYDERQHTLQTIQDLYVFLTAQHHLPAEASARINQAVQTLLSRPDRLTRID